MVKPRIKGFALQRRYCISSANYIQVARKYTYDLLTFRIKSFEEWLISYFTFIGQLTLQAPNTPLIEHIFLSSRGN